MKLRSDANLQIMGREDGVSALTLPRANTVTFD